MPKRNDVLLLEDILESISKIETYTNDLQFEEFYSADKTKDAVIRNFEIIGDAVNNLSVSFMLENNEIKWRKIGAFRNRLIHEYFGVNYEAVWMVIKNNLQDLKKYIFDINLNSQ